VGVTAVVAAAALAIFVAVVARFDPSTLRLLLRRGQSPTGG